MLTRTRARVQAAVAAAAAPAATAAPVAATATTAAAAAAAVTDILSATSWSTTKAYRAMVSKETQRAYYSRMGCSEPVLQLVQLDSKPFGSEAEKILCEIFSLGKRTSTENDATRAGKKIEIKAARYWAGKDDCKWQHLEPDHDYDVVLFALLDFHGWKLWGLEKSVLMGPLRETGIVNKQGRQGYWATKSALLPHLIPLRSLTELDAFLERA